MTDGPPVADGGVESRFGARAGSGSRGSALVAVFTLVAAFGLAGGPLGALAGATTAFVWYLVGTPYAIAVGHVLLIAVFPGSIGPITFVVVEAGFLVLVLEPAIRSAVPGHVAAVTLTTVAALGGLAWLLGTSQSLWLAAAITSGGLVFLSYGCYRYGQVTLGLVDDPDAPHTDGDA